MSRINEGGHALEAADAVLEFQSRRDMWAATRYGLKRRWCSPRLPLEACPRFKLDQLDREGREHLCRFLDEQGINYAVVSDAEAKRRQEDERQALQRTGNRVRSAE